MTSIECLTSLIDTFNATLEAQVTRHQCICGIDMQWIDNAIMYRCDVCHKTAESMNMFTFWHCPQEFNLQHPDGYDICDGCAFDATQLTQEDHTHHRHKSKEETVEPLHCPFNAACDTLVNFIKIMKHYYQNHVQCIETMDASKLLKITNDYLHILQYHDTDDQFTAIYNVLDQCDMTKCAMFARNNRNRITNADHMTQPYDHRYIIMDKMHCYFHHSYEIGNRLSNDDMRKLQRVISEIEQKHDEDGTFDEILLNGKAIKMYEMIHLKRIIHNDFYKKLNEQYFSKYNQLCSAVKENQDKSNVKLVESSIFALGHEFHYGYAGEIKAPMLRGFPVPNPIVFSEKEAVFASLKEEVLNNPFAILNMDQYQNECKKAGIYLASRYCRDHYKSHDTVNDDPYELYQNIHWEFELEYILAMMLYCNFTALQFYFSKTYRDNKGNDHKYFYHWGKCLKICTQQFGDAISKTFYHGISHKAHFASYVNHDHVEGINIWSPVSTSVSYPVALNFAKEHGLLVEISDTAHMVSMKRKFEINSKSLSVSWLSDFPGEREWLFVQSVSNLLIINILEIESGFEYKMIFTAMQIIHEVIRGLFYSERLQIMNDSDMRRLISMILKDRVNAHIFEQYKPSLTLSAFAQQMLNTLFLNQKTVCVHYWRWRKDAALFATLLLHHDYEWIDLDSTCALFPNVSAINVSNICLCNAIFDNILQYLSENENDPQLTDISISFLSENSEISIEDAVHNYSSAFRKKDRFIYMDLYQKLDQHLLGSDSNDEEQLWFNSRCNGLENVMISWSIFAKSQDSTLYKYLCHPEVEGWVIMDILIQLFPNIKFLLINYGQLNGIVMKDIYDRLKSGNSALTRISIVDPSGDLSILQAQAQYKRQFAGINWRLDAYDDVGEEGLDFQKLAVDEENE
eukprot:926083_1